MSMSADQILNLRISERDRIFPKAVTEARKAFRKLAATWHPDVCHDPRAAQVFAHLVALRDAGPSSAKPSVSPDFTLETSEGKRLGLSTLSVTPVDTGQVLMSRRAYTSVFDAGASDLAAQAVTQIEGFRFADAKMEAQMRPFLTSISKRIPLKQGGEALAMPRKCGDILLSDILRIKGIIPEKHAAWISSGLLNIACWLDWAKLVHGAISPERILIDPEAHSVRLVGGWEFATPVGQRPTALPGRTLDLAPRLAIKGEVVDSTLDRELIRRTIREALGDPAGTRLLQGPLPRPLANWLIMPPAKTAVEDYTSWVSALEAAWGKRSFVHWDLHPENIYGTAD